MLQRIRLTLLFNILLATFVTIAHGNLFYLGHRPIGEVEPPELLRACERVQDRDAVESAHRLLTTASGVWQFAIAKGYATRDIVPA